MTKVVLGIGRQARATAQYWSAQGADVILTDQRTADQLGDLIDELAVLPGVTFSLGGHPLELLDDADELYVAGGVPLEIPFVQAAIERDVRLTNDSQLFLELAPCPVIGITGSAGKTTTTALTGALLRNSGAYRKVWVGGNIGYPLLHDLDQMHPSDIAVMELSSFQLDLMTISPEIATVLNVTPNHLDRHGTMAAYTAAKANVLAFQNAANQALLCADEIGSAALAAGTLSEQLWWFGTSLPAKAQYGAYQSGTALLLRTPQGEQQFATVTDVQLRGAHNVLNVLSACALAAMAGADPATFAAAIQEFHGVAHRLEMVRDLQDVSWYNDSIATAPERTLAAVKAFDEPLILMLGGVDKKLPWDVLAQELQAKGVKSITFGRAGSMIANVLRAHEATVIEAGDFASAVEKAHAVSQAGDVVLLSPGCTSFDEFVDFAARGVRFRELVNQL